MQVLTAEPDVGADPRWLAFVAQAVDQQLREFCTAWGVEYTPLSYMGPDVLLNLAGNALAAFLADSRMMTIRKSLDVPGALGYHSSLGPVVYAEILWQGQGDATSTTVSHEALEEAGDPQCDQTRKMPNGSATALEACDACEGDSYVETASIGPDSMPIAVSDYLLNAWFDPNGVAPFDRMNRCTKPFETRPGGYQVVTDSAGESTEVFARVVAGPLAHFTVAAKLANPRGRLIRRIRGQAAP